PSAVAGTAGSLTVVPGGGTDYASALGPGDSERVWFRSGAGLGLRFGSGSFSAPGRIADVSAIIPPDGREPVAAPGICTMRVGCSGPGVNQVGGPKVVPLGVGAASRRAAWQGGEARPPAGEPWTDEGGQPLCSTERIIVWAPPLSI